MGTATLRESQILNIVKEDPTITNPALAKRLGLKPSSIKGILRRLTNSGSIKSTVVAPGIPGGRQITVLSEIAEGDENA